MCFFLSSISTFFLLLSIMRDVVDPTMCQTICHARGKYDYPGVLPGAACAVKVSLLQSWTDCSTDWNAGQAGQDEKQTVEKSPPNYYIYALRQSIGGQI